MSKERKISRVALASIVFGLLGLGSGILIHSFNFDCNTDDLPFLNRNLVCVEQPTIRKHSYISLKRDLESYIKDKITSEEATEISIYFRDLHFGPTLGINEHTMFSPASLLKLPLLLAYYNIKNESRPMLFWEKIKISKVDDTLSPFVGPEQKALLDEEYTVSELLTMMIKYSDNTSYYALSAYLNQIFPERNVQKETLLGLGIIAPEDIFDNAVSVKTYGSVFVQLYNSSFFSDKESSNEVLAMLAGAKWDGGLERGVPKNIGVAHKFGERENFDTNVVQFHDCGVVYFPENPYLLCVMTRGQDIKMLPNIVGEISKMFYNELNSRRI